MNQVYSPGCALFLYKPHLIEKIEKYLYTKNADIKRYVRCCNFAPTLPKGTEIINTCAGCDREFSAVGNGITTISLWEVLADSDFPFPDYAEAKISIQDACPVREKESVHIAIRRLLERMNFNIVESEFHSNNSICCGDSFYPDAEKDIIYEAMKKRAEQMPEADVAVYCVSCIKAVEIGGKKPRYMVDLLFNEPTDFSNLDFFEYHKKLDAFIKESENA